MYSQAKQPTTHEHHPYHYDDNDDKEENNTHQTGHTYSSWAATSSLLASPPPQPLPAQSPLTLPINRSGTLTSALAYDYNHHHPPSHRTSLSRSTTPLSPGTLSIGAPPSHTLVSYAAPLVQACQHLLRPNGSMLGREVAQAILPLFPHFLSAIPTDVPPSGLNTTVAMMMMMDADEVVHTSSATSSPPSSPYRRRSHHHPRAVAAAATVALEKKWSESHSPTHAMQETFFPGPSAGAPAEAPSSSWVSLPRPALASIDGREMLSHAQIHHFLSETIRPVLHQQLQVGRGHRVAVVLPNGPELALAILAISTYCACVPLNAFGAAAELEADWRQARVDLVLGLVSPTTSGNSHSGSTNNSTSPPTIRELAARCQLPFCGLVPDPHVAGLFTLVPPSQPVPPHARPLPSTAVLPQDHQEEEEDDGTLRPHLAARYIPNTHDDVVLILFTSGTTGSKKLVPHRCRDILIATACIAVSWKLTVTDVNINLMPLFHVGGIIRQVYSPILSGGCVICCPSFEPLLFWQLLYPAHYHHSLRRQQPSSAVMAHNQHTVLPTFTWYYAAPTMHQLILQTGRQEGYLPSSSSKINHTSSNGTSAANAHSNNNHPGAGGVPMGTPSALPPPKLRMIANAAGGLLPSLARELRQAFGGAHVLPSYGMTECMPISSPPAHYQLEKPGTSGVAVGPEICILDLDTLQAMVPGKEGPICVRGEPCFGGYEYLPSEAGRRDLLDDAAPESIQTGTFLPGGWFNTGDLGYMDADGYLYITGRSKEVINRGGEIISPMEVEEAINTHPDISACVAFSTAHNVLQEVVGVVLVPAPNRPRLDLSALHEYLGQGRLVAAKWPQCLVYMDALPKSHTNKLLRVKLGQRLGLPELNDNMYPIERIFQATCPPQGTPVSVAIPCSRVTVDAHLVQEVLRAALIEMPLDQQDLVVVPHPSKIGALVCYVYNVDRMAVVKVARERLDAYAVPGHVCLCTSGPIIRDTFEDDPYFMIRMTPPQPSDAIGSILQEASWAGRGPADPLVLELQELWQVLLDLDCLPAPDSNFFNVGGSSMLASQLASRIRKAHKVPFGGAEVFHHSSCNALASLIRSRRGDGQRAEADNSVGDPASMAASSHFSKNLDLTGTPFHPVRVESRSGFWATLFQLIPIVLVYPAYQISRIFAFFRCLLWVVHTVPNTHQIVLFIFTVVAFHAAWTTVMPLLFVLIKWTVIGTYRKGRYRLWGEYYLRWWLVDILRKMIGRGLWGSDEKLILIYYRLLGAKIGANARISVAADIAEYDLVTIGEGAAVEYCTVRAFGVDNGCMILGPVRVGAHASVGVRSVVAPYTSIPDNMHLGPCTSSYEINANYDLLGEDIMHARYNRQALPEPTQISKLFIVAPISFAVSTASHTPAMIILFWMLRMPWHHNDPFQTMGDLLAWLSDVRRIPFFLGIRVVRAVVAPVLYMAAAILVKWLVIGKFHAGPRNTDSEWQLIRHHLAASLFSRESIQECTELLGRHFELVSVLYRLLGAKVGKRVFWPGHQPIFSGEFDLLEIGDDVVFGSRTVILCTTKSSIERVTLCAGSNVSDNTVVLPGSIVGKNAVLGSNSVCPEGRYLPESSVWFGSRGGEPVILEKGPDVYLGPIHASDIDRGKLQLVGDESTLRPFGKAFYKRDAPYFVWPLALIILFTLVTRCIIALLHTIPALGSVYLSAGYFFGWSYVNRNYNMYNQSTSTVFSVMLFFYCLAHFGYVLIWLGAEVSSKWLLMGQRKEGRYNWDATNYCQNWELYQITTHVRTAGRMNILDFLTGTPMMATFFRLLGCKMGKDCCLYPSGGDPYMPEPDLVEMGDRCTIDCSAIVCHLNTRGNFELAKIVMENNVTLRTRSRIQQGVHMESGSMILEKSLAMTGEVIEADSIWLGAPASRLMSYDNVSSIATPSCGGSQSGAYV